MATSVLGNCICYDIDGIPAMHNFGDHNDSCMIPITVISNDTTISSVFNVPAWYGQSNAPFTADDARNTIISFENQIENKAKANATIIENPPIAWYTENIAPTIQ